MENIEKELLENEWYHVRYSGEIPEIALHSSIFHLTEDEEGPRIQLSEAGLGYLQEAAKHRYLEIILRDIIPQNRDETHYRGILRTISNWRRFKRFCERHGMRAETLREQIAVQAMAFLNNEIADVAKGERQSCINCTFEDIVSFAVELGFSLDGIEKDLRPLCLSF